MKELTSKDSRIAYFFNSLNRVTIKLESLLVNHKPLFNGDRYLTDEELSSRLKIHRRTLNDYRKNGILPYYHFGGKILYSENDILKILDDSYLSGLEREIKFGKYSYWIIHADIEFVEEEQKNNGVVPRRATPF